VRFPNSIRHKLSSLMATHSQEWHCTIRGPPDTDFEGGVYHFRILLPAEYPFRPPSIMMLTPNGRFELNTKVSYVDQRHS
jgi:ubiquitin-protein ligase